LYFDFCIKIIFLKKITSLLLSALAILFSASIIMAQSQPVQRICATDEKAQQVFQTDPAARARYENTQRFLENQIQTVLNNRQQRTQAIVTIPVVVHIAIANPSLVTDVTVQRQLDTLNFYYGTQQPGDSLRVYTPFRTTYGRTEIRFCLAQRTPFNTSTTGVTRTTTTTTFTMSGSHPNTVVAPWDVTKYLNIWVVNFTDGTLGFAPFPGLYPVGSPNIGYVNDYRAFGSGEAYLYSLYNLGKTAVHEIGHYFNLSHPWGNGGSNSSCTGTDNCADTPPTAGPTFGCLASPVLNACSSIAPGIMNQNHMDYGDDGCMFLFTVNQVTRMTAGLTSPDRSTLLTSNGCQPVIGGPVNRDISVIAINNPDAECNGNFTPNITVKNNAVETVTAFSVSYRINNGALQTSTFTGQNIPFNGTLSVNLSAATGTTAAGQHTITAFTFNPVSLTGTGDQVLSNDTLTRPFAILGTLASPLIENFTNTLFPPAGWGVYNPDADQTWKRDPVGNNNAGSAMMNNYRYNALGQFDYLHTPEITYTGVDSILMSFDIAAVTRIAPNNTILPTDTVEVLVTTNCGASYTSIYKKWGAVLQTINDPVNPQPNEFFPSGSSQWRTEKFDLSSYAPNGPLHIVFKNSNAFGNNVFIDNVNIRTRILPAALKVDGIQLFPSPFTTMFQVWHLQTPTTLRYINVYNTAGQLVWSKQYNGGALKIEDVDMSRNARGLYIVEMGYTDKSKNVQLKVIKSN
jgi:hypothetical protein